jgi:excisionase family DNA binding protein
MLKVTSPEILEYRKAIEERKLDLPIWNARFLTCEEAAAYSGIGIKRIRKMALTKGCNFSISNGTQILINREKFDKYMDKVERFRRKRLWQRQKDEINQE